MRKRARARGGSRANCEQNGRYAPDLGILEQKHIDRLVTMHTSIASGDVWCKYQISSVLPQGSRSLTEEKEDDEKIQKTRMRKICSSGNTKVSTSLEGIASATDGSVNR